MDPAPLALATWGVELVDGAICVGGSAIHPVAARELWLRLGTLLDGQERDEDSLAWARLEKHLDAAFRGAVPCRGRSGRVVQTGLVLRESQNRAIVRLATFSVAVLRRRRGHWEGAVLAARPASHGWDARPMGLAYRLEPEQVPTARPPLLPPPAPRPLLTMATKPVPRSDMPVPRSDMPVPPPPRPPVQSEQVRAARDRGAAAAAPVLALLEGGPKTFMALREALPEMPEEELRARLTWLAELQRVRRRGPSWTLVRPRERPAVATKPSTLVPAPPAPPAGALVPLVHPKTYEHRAAIKASGGHWDHARKQWMVPPDQHAVLLARVSGRPSVTPAKPRRSPPAPTKPPAPLLPFRLCQNAKCQTAARTSASTCPRCKQPYP